MTYFVSWNLSIMVKASEETFSPLTTPVWCAGGFGQADFSLKFRQVLSAETRFSADKGLSAERPARGGFWAEKWRRRQLRSTCGARESNRRPLPPATWAVPNPDGAKTNIIYQKQRILICPS